MVIVILREVAIVVVVVIIKMIIIMTVAVIRIIAVNVGQDRSFIPYSCSKI